MGDKTPKASTGVGCVKGCPPPTELHFRAFSRTFESKGSGTPENVTDFFLSDLNENLVLVKSAAPL